MLYMKKIISLFILFSFLVVFSGCSKVTGSGSGISYNTSNDNYVEAVTPTYINRLSDKSISFTKEITCLESQLGKAVSISPKQKGTFSLLDKKTVVYYYSAGNNSINEFEE